MCFQVSQVIIISSDSELWDGGEMVSRNRCLCLLLGLFICYLRSIHTDWSIINVDGAWFQCRRYALSELHDVAHTGSGADLSWFVV